MSTLDLFGWTKPTLASRPKQSPNRRKPTIEARFLAFHKANPHVFDEMRRLARARIAAGQTFISIKALWEELRVSLDRVADGGLGGLDGAYKLNNSYTALYARKLIASDPAFAKVIEIRRRKGER